jgi:hypothetical protein
MSNKLIKQGAAVGSKILGGLLFLTLLTGCGGGKPNTALKSPNGVNYMAREKAIEKIGGFGACQGDCLLAEAAAETRGTKNKPKDNKLDNKYFQLVKEVDGQPLIKALMMRKVLKETEKGQKAGKKPKKDLVLKEGLSGAYEKLVKVILEDDPKAERTRHAKLLVLVEGLRFAHNTGQSLDNEQGVKALKAEFEARLAEAVAGVIAKVEKDATKWPPIIFEFDSAKFNKGKIKDQAEYKLGDKCKAAVEVFIKEVGEAVEEYKKEMTEMAKDAK